MTRNELKELACLGFSSELVMQSCCHTADYPKPIDISTHHTLPDFNQTRGGVALRPGDGIIHSWLNRMLLPDTVGTGGDGSGSLNLSTGTGLLAAASGVNIVKHGNRSISSRSGSADMLEKIGMIFPETPASAVNLLNDLGFTFLFSPAFHPAMKAIMPVRNSLAIRTVFNMLGPLSNPASPPFQLIGAFSDDAAKLMAETLSGLPIKRAFVVHGAEGWDEATPIGNFLIYDVRPGSVKKGIRSPEDYGLKICQASDLLGDDADYNAGEMRRVFYCEDKAAHRDALTMGVSLVLELMGKVKNPRDGIKIAEETLNSGKASQFLDNFKSYFQSI